MPLTSTRIKAAKPRSGNYKMTDGGGMYLLVKNNGRKYWRLDYRFRGKRKTLALGVYPKVSLKDAREKRRQARFQLENSQDPGAIRKEEKQSTMIAMRDEQIDEMIQTARAFGVAAMHLRDLEASPDKPAGYGMFKAVCVNAGYAMELLLKVLCYMHNGRFKKTHCLTSLHDSLPESVRTGLEATFLGNIERLGAKIQWMSFEVSPEGQQRLQVPFSFCGYLREFDRVGMTSQRYPTTLLSSGEPMPNHVHQATIGVLTLDAAVRHFTNRP